MDYFKSIFLFFAFYFIISVYPCSSVVNSLFPNPKTDPKQKPTPVSKQVPKTTLVPYSNIEETLLATWNETYPVPYTKIIQKDLVGKGTMQLKGKEPIYLYSFLVFMPRYALDETKTLVALDDGKEVTVKLYFNPKKEEKEQYWIDLGEFMERVQPWMVLKYIK